MSVLISVPICMAISQYSNLNHACGVVSRLTAALPYLAVLQMQYHMLLLIAKTDNFIYSGGRTIPKTWWFLSQVTLIYWLLVQGATLNLIN